MSEVIDKTLAAARCHPDVRWAVEVGGVRLVRSDTGKTELLSYPEAALRDLLTRGLSIDRVVRTLAAICRMDENQAYQRMIRAIAQWIEEGWMR